ncbi:helix-turn-helix transcriptional regulator [Lentzea tibetensis]|uniref:helix-turn-helix transcriptional regulator n=1 Tax=Lentzea tibetensis TaxID=2591470 RepID=UPI0016477083|nr:helix-turn-helix transcriptional regulator [Lentzea tibetensis]
MTFVEEGRRAQPDGVMPWAVLDGLSRLIPCDSVGFVEVDAPQKVFLTDQWVQVGERELEQNVGDADNPYWVLWRDFLPCGYADRTGDTRSIVMYSDFYTQPQLAATPYVIDMRSRPVHRMLVRLATAPGRKRCILIDRFDGADFTERDRMVLQLLRPHLYEIYLDVQRKRGGVPQLSRRELDVLLLAAQGQSNASIADELFIAVSTVRKHLKHLFDRTGARSRAAAAALVLPHVR